MFSKIDVLEINKLVFDYVMNLDEITILELLKGEKKLSLNENRKEETITINKDSVPVVSKNKKTLNKKEKENKDNSNEVELIQNGKELLAKGISREEAANYFNKKVFTVKVLKDLAKEIDIYIKSRSTKGEIIDKIIEGTIGARLKMKALKEK